MSHKPCAFPHGSTLILFTASLVVGHGTAFQLLQTHRESESHLERVQDATLEAESWGQQPGPLEYFGTSFGDSLSSEVCNDLLGAPRNYERSNESKKIQWIFAVSAGHSGSTTAGDIDNYNTSSQMCVEFEASKRLYFNNGKHDGKRCGSRDTFEADVLELNLSHPCGQSGWHEYARAAAAVHSPSSLKRARCEFQRAADERTHAVVLPHYYNNSEDCRRRNGDAVSLHMDLGHHILFGLGDSLVRALTLENVFFFRLRRGRLANALSYLAEDKIPCSGIGGFILCPHAHGSALFATMGDAAAVRWSQLNDFQRCLWYVDEVEARWQMFLAAHTELRHAEVNWTDTDSLALALKQIAGSLEQEWSHALNRAVQVSSTASMSNTRHHSSGIDGLPDAAEQRRMSDDYFTIMQYTDSQMDLIAKQQFD